MVYRVRVVKYGYADIEADNADEAIEIIDDMSNKDFNWTGFDEPEIIDEFER